jgi:hypothetical protein
LLTLSQSKEVLYAKISQKDVFSERTWVVDLFTTRNSLHMRAIQMADSLYYTLLDAAVGKVINLPPSMEKRCWELISSFQVAFSTLVFIIPTSLAFSVLASRTEGLWENRWMQEQSLDWIQQIASQVYFDTWLRVGAVVLIAGRRLYDEITLRRHLWPVYRDRAGSERNVAPTGLVRPVVSGVASGLVGYFFPLVAIPFSFESLDDNASFRFLFPLSLLVPGIGTYMYVPEFAGLGGAFTLGVYIFGMIY